jgi:type IV secretory pathway VirB2 component (pilin)
MNQASKRTNRFIATVAGAAVTALWPLPAQAAAGYGFPWDQPLLSLQQALTGTVAPVAIAFAFAGAVVLYALGGHDKQAGRLFGSGLGGCIALAIVHFLNYVAL